MNSRVDPSTPLREQNTPRLGSHRVRNRIRAKLGFKRREMLHQQRRQKPILSQREQVLLVQRVDIGFGVFLNDAIGDDDGPTLVCSPDSIQRETTRQTGDGTKEGFKGLGEMVRNVVFVDLDHRPPRTFLIRQLGLSTNADDPGIVRRNGDQPVKGVRSNSLKKNSVNNRFVSCNRNKMHYRIGIHGEDVFIKRRINANNISHLVVNLQLQRRHWHIEMDTIEVMQQEDLRVSLSTIARFRSFSGFTDLGDDHVPMQKLDLNEKLAENKKETHGTTCPSNSYKPEYTFP